MKPNPTCSASPPTWSAAADAADPGGADRVVDRVDAYVAQPALAEALRARVAENVEGVPAADLDVAVFSRLSQLVLDSPAPPAVRAAAFRALAVAASADHRPEDVPPPGGRHRTHDA